MTDGMDNLGQDEIEELLRQAAAGASASASASAKPAAQPGAAAPPASERPRPTVEIGPPPVAASPPPPAASHSSPVDDDIQFLLAQAEQAIRSVNEPIDSQIPHLSRFELQDLTGAPASTERASLELLRDVELDLRIELGRTHMYLEDVLQLRRGSVVPLDKLAGDPVDVFVNGRLVARGEVLVLNDNFCVRIAELISGDEGD
ncbi:MAG: flagellar motor switch protein FliN [Pirellulaceae bacterium]